MDIFYIIKNKILSINGKNRRIIKNTGLSFIVKALSLIVSLFTMPAYLNYFDNKEVLGLWFATISVFSWILTFDLGIGNGLRNHLVETIVNQDMIKTKEYISSAYLINGLVVLIISMFGYYILPFINWNYVFNISISLVSPQILLKVIRIIFLGIMLQFFLRTISSILYALQESAIPGIIGLLSNIIILIFVLIFDSQNHEQGIIILSIINVLSVNIPLIIATIILFVTRLKDCIPNTKYFNMKYTYDIIRLGGAFFWVQIMYMCITNTNEILISWYSEIDNVVNYKIYNSIFNLISGIIILSLTPIWSEVTEACIKKDILWVNRLYKYLKYLGVFALVCEIIIALLLQTIVNLWLNDKAIIVDLNYAIVFALAGTVYIWNAINSSIVNGIGKLKISVIFLTIGAVINIPLAYFLTNINIGWISIIYANIISFLPFCIVQSLWIRKYLSQKIISSENIIIKQSINYL